MKKKGLVIIIFSVFVLFLFFGVIAMVAFISNGFSDSKSERKFYQYSEISSGLNETNSGYVSLSKQLEDSEYISYSIKFLEKKTLSFISNFGGTEYECTGSCFCEEDENNISRKNIQMGTLLNRGLFLVLTAMTASVAFNIAKESFLNNCVEEYSNVCAQSDIQAEVSDCKNMEQVIPTSETEITGITEEYDQKEYSFDCFGHCVRNYRIAIPETLEAVAKFGDCSKVNMQKSIVVQIIETPSKSALITRARVKAVNQMKKEMTLFCKENSVVTFRYPYEITGKGTKVYFTSQRKVANACVVGGIRNKNISCKKKSVRDL